tara:strand:- start:195 stop:632 length:438 start_codon:yes stop_codon:yes gene_type:complete
MVIKTKFEVCKEEKMNKIMKEYEYGKLKNRSNQKIKSRKQAVAIGLSISQSGCEKLFSKKDIEKIEERLFKDLYDNKGNIKRNKDISFTSVKSAIKLYNYYKKEKKYNKANKIKDDLILRVFLDMKNSNKYLNTLIIDELINFLK